MMKKTLCSLLLFSILAASAKDAAPVDAETFDDLRAKLKNVKPESPFLLQVRDDVTKELSNISHRIEADPVLQRQAAVRAVNLLEFLRFFQDRANKRFSMAKAPFVPVEAPAFPDFIPERGLFSVGQRITDTFRFAGAKGEESIFEMQLYPLKDNMDFTLTADDFKNENGNQLPSSIVTFTTAAKAEKALRPSVYRGTYRIPADAEPGLYSAQLHVRTGDETFNLTLMLRVYPFALPPPKAFDETTDFEVFTPDGGTGFRSAHTVIRAERKSGEKDVFLLHPTDRKLSGDILKEGRIATRGKTEQFIHIPAEHLLHIQDTLSFDDAFCWHVIKGKILYEPSAGHAPGILRRMAGIQPYRHYYDGVFLPDAAFSQESLREAVNDVRYVTLLRSLLKKAYAEKHYSAIFAGKKAVAWFMEINTADCNLDLMRYELADHITYIQNILNRPSAEVVK